MAAINVVRKRSREIFAGRNKLEFDYWLLLGAGALLVIGFLMVYSTTFDLGFRREDNPVHFVTRQMIAMLIGVKIAATSAASASGMYFAERRTASPSLSSRDMVATSIAVPPRGRRSDVRPAPKLLRRGRAQPAGGQPNRMSTSPASASCVHAAPHSSIAS